MADVVLMRRGAARVGRLLIVAVLIPAPLDRFAAELAEESDILLDVGEVESRIAILVGKPVDPAAHEGQRQRREGEVGGDVGWAPVLLGRGRLAARRRIVELRAPPRLGIIDHRRALGGRRARIGLAVDRAADRSGEAVLSRLGRRAGVLDPLRLARLAGDHGDGVRRRGRIFGGEDVVEDCEAAGVAPEERDGVAVDVRHDEARELLAHRLAFGAARARVATPLDKRELVHLRNAVLNVDLGGEAGVRMVGRVLECRVLLRADAKRLNRDGLAGICVDIGLREARRVGGRARIFSIGIEAVDARESAVFVVERAVLVEDHEHIFHLLPQRLDVLLGPVRVGPARVRVGDEIRRDVGARIGLGRDHWPQIGGESGLKQAGDSDQGRRAAKHSLHSSLLPENKVGQRGGFFGSASAAPSNSHFCVTVDPPPRFSSLRGRDASRSGYGRARRKFRRCPHPF